MMETPAELPNNLTGGASSSIYNVKSDVTSPMTSPKDNVTTLHVSAVSYPWDSPGNLISHHTLRTIEDTITCGLNPILLAVGVPCNALSCLIFMRQGLRDRMNVSLFSLALVDLFCIFFWFLLGSSCLVGRLSLDLPVNMEWWKWIVRKYVRGLHRGFLYSSGCLTMLISVERCVCVSLPLKAANLIRTQTMTLFIVTIVTSLHLLCLIYPFKFDVATVHDTVTGKTIVTLPHTPYFLRHRRFLDVLENYVIMSAIPFFTFVVVVIATLLTVLQLKRLLTWREGTAATANTAGKKAQVALVKMLVIVSCIYIVTASPNIIFGIVRPLFPQFWLTGKHRNAFVASHLLYLTLGTVNSTVNFFVYVSRSSRFRQHLVHLFPCCSRLCGFGDPYADVKGTLGVTSVNTDVISASSGVYEKP